MRENRSNVAVARPLTDSTAAVKKKKKPLLKGLPIGEKLLYLFSILVCVTLALTVISGYAKITELNVAIQKTENEIKQAQKVNLKLETEKKKLGSVERIREFAESKGLELNAPKVLPSIQP